MYLLNNVISVLLSTAMMGEPTEIRENKATHVPFLGDSYIFFVFFLCCHFLLQLIASFSRLVLIFLSSFLSSQMPSSLSYISCVLFSFHCSSSSCIFIFPPIIIFSSTSVISSSYLLSIYISSSYFSLYCTSFPLLSSLSSICSFPFTFPSFSPPTPPFLFLFSFSQYYYQQKFDIFLANF
jgi:hypothetical protein